VAERTSELADILVEGLYDGKPLRQLCRENGISKSAVYRWFDDDAELAGRIARAREQGYHEIADECLEIADEEPSDAVDVADKKVRIETRLKLLAKWSPKNYGEKQLIGSDPENPLPQGLQVAFVKEASPDAG
jgi:AcrR family transcriptional regulator